MSFKREGNDNHLLNVLRQRRIKDLLADEIPQNEAKLLSNGRLACIVCSSYPIFDTVNMLTIHRKGKKHLANVVYKEQEKQELQNLIIKRKHEQFLKDGTTNIQQATTYHKGLSCSMPYDSRVKKHKIKPYDRKPTLNLIETSRTELVSSLGCGNIPVIPHHVEEIQGKRNSECRESALCETNTVSHNYLPGNQNFTSQMSTDNHNNLSGNRDPTSSKSVPLEKKNVLKKKRAVDSKYLEMITMQSEGPVKHSSQLSKMFKKSVDNAFTVNRPYVSKKELKLTSNVNRQAETNVFNRKHPPIKISLKRYICKKDSPIQKRDASFSQIATHSCDDRSQVTMPTLQQSKVAQCKTRSPAGLPSAGQKQEKTDRGKKWHLGGSGWKKDWDGKWIKDEEAEFDSDEEPPEL